MYPFRAGHTEGESSYGDLPIRCLALPAAVRNFLDNKGKGSRKKYSGRIIFPIASNTDNAASGNRCKTSLGAHYDKRHSLLPVSVPAERTPKALWLLLKNKSINS